MRGKPGEAAAIGRGAAQMATKAARAATQTAALPEPDFSPAAQLVVSLAYHGARFHGFARQENPPQRTVQGELEAALSTLLRRRATTVCAGRTDAGVHALGQVVNCPVSAGELSSLGSAAVLDKMRVSLNALTGDDVAVRALRPGPPAFSARFDAVRRVYRYRIVCGPVPPLFLRDFSWWHRTPLDVDAMRAAAARFVGEHDFKSFCRAASAQGKNTVRTVESVEVFEEEALGESCLSVEVVGNAFLHSMVRTMVGTLVEVGEGKRAPQSVAGVLAACDRAAAGETAPAQGLVFERVDYPPAAFDLDGSVPAVAKQREDVIRDPNRDAALRAVLEETSAQVPVELSDADARDLLSSRRLADYENLA